MKINKKLYTYIHINNVFLDNMKTQQGHLINKLFYIKCIQQQQEKTLYININYLKREKRNVILIYKFKTKSYIL